MPARHGIRPLVLLAGPGEQAVEDVLRGWILDGDVDHVEARQQVGRDP